MLITSLEILPLQTPGRAPIVGGRLHVREGRDTRSLRLELFRDAAFSTSAANPVILNSAGELPYPVYARENSAWCHVCVIKNGIEELVHSYPLRIMPSASLYVDNDTEAITQRIRVRVKAETEIIQGKNQAKIPSILFSNVTACAISLPPKTGHAASADTMESEILTIGDYYVGAFGEDVVPSPVVIAERTWWDAFAVGSYAIAEYESNALGEEDPDYPGYMELPQIAYVTLKERRLWLQKEKPSHGYYATVRAMVLLESEVIGKLSYSRYFVCRVRDKDDKN